MNIHVQKITTVVLSRIWIAEKTNYNESINALL